MTSSPENRAQLLDDLTGDVNLARAFKERPELVRAWEVFKIHGDDLTTDIPSLTKMSDHLVDNPNLYSYLDGVDNFNAYKAYLSSNTNAINAVKNIQASGKLHSWLEFCNQFIILKKN